MVNAQEYIDTNYPKGGTREKVEGELDLSNKNLTGWLNFGGFTSVQKLNFSFNEIAGLGFGYGEKKLEVLDVSHNRLGPTIGGFSYSLKFVNFSNNFYSEVSLGMISLTHLDVSNNALTNLWIKSSGNLTELKCYGNPLLTNLTLAPNLNISSFSLSDCPALSLLNPTSTASSSSLLPPPTFQPENGNELSNSDKIAIGLGVPGFAVAAATAWVAYKQLKASKEKKKKEITMQRTIAEEVISNDETAKEQIEAQIQIPPK